MSVEKPISISSDSEERRARSGSMRDGLTPRRIPRVLRPATLGYIGLALAVFLWGYGYKLSLYRQASNKHFVVAKLWDKHQSLTSSVSTTKTQQGAQASSPLSAILPGIDPAAGESAVQPQPRNVVKSSSHRYRRSLRSPPQRA